jgi:hypothetical protein
MAGMNKTNGELKACPNCNNVGWYVMADTNGEPEQVQCQFCYTEPNSVFNVVNALNEQITKQSALIEMMGFALYTCLLAERDGDADWVAGNDAYTAYTLWKKENGK